jgi:outer membrane receptor for ferrienterochelin and colicins
MHYPLCLLCCLLGPLLLPGQTDSILLSVDIEDVVVTAQYTPTVARNAVQRVEVIDQREWREQGLVNLSDLLQRQLTMRISADPILGNGLAIQGLGGQNVQIMIDGVPVIGRLGGEIDLTQLSLARFERVEIVTGAQSARYGSDAAGGVINLITRQEQYKKWSLEAGGQYETVDLDQQQIRIGRKLGDFHLEAGVDRYRARFAPLDSLRAGTVPWNPKEQVGYNASLVYAPNDSLRIRYGYRGFAEELSLFGEVRRPHFRPYVRDQFFDTHRRDHALSATYRFNPVWTADLTAGSNAFDRYRRAERRDLEPDTIRLLTGEQDTTRYTGTLGRLSLSSASGGRFDAQFGLEYRRESGAGRRILNTASADRDPVLLNLAAWAGLTYRPHEEWTVEATTRSGYNNRYDHPVVPALHVLWKPSPAWRWRAGYAAGFRAPSLQELFFNFIDVNHFIVGNQNLEAERSTNLRLSGEWIDLKRLPLTVRGELFYNRIRQRITLADMGEVRFSYLNLDRYETHGATLQLELTPSEQVTLLTGGALTRLTNPAAAEESHLPDYLTLGELRNELIYRPDPLGLTLRIDHRYVGRRDRYILADDGNFTQGFIGDYHLLHATASKSLWEDRIILTAGVKNLLNRDRVPVTGGSGGGAHSGGGGGGQLIDFGRSGFVGARLAL